jgi:rare lipoprotein A
MTQPAQPFRLAVAGIFLLWLGACTTVDLTPSVEEPARPKPAARAAPPAEAPVAKGRGAYYLDDGPDEKVPEGLINTPDAEPRVEPIAKGPSKPYTIFEKAYTPITDSRPFVQRGTGSWYGKKFHGQRTASGEIYNMYAMTAAHPTLPIPSYARVTNLRNGSQVIVRVNDRGPFHSERIIDLSYTAALKLGYVGKGSAELEVERLLPDDIARIQAEKRGKPVAPAVNADEADAIARIAHNSDTPPVAAGTGGFYLQFGAYAQATNAQAMRERLLSGWPQELPPPAVIQSQGLYRLHSGPFSSREAAGKAARQLQASAQIQAAVVQK